MNSRRVMVIGLGFAAGIVRLAQAQPAQPPPPEPPPPQAPPENWAPPQPVEQPAEQKPAPAKKPPTLVGQPPPAAAEQGNYGNYTGPTPPPSEPAKSVVPGPEDVEETSTSFDIYGFAMFDGGYDFGHIGNPNWADTMRPTKLPAFKNEFGTGGRTFMSVRQSRFGVSSNTETNAGEIKTKFEFELFGTGVDEGQTTFRLRHAYGDWKTLRAGQTWSPFMDIDVFPNSIEYWGPNGMVFFRNVQLAWMPIQGESRVTIAAERPGASADLANYAERIELQGIVPRFPAPDVSAEGRYGGKWGYVEAAGILRWIKWDDLDNMGPNFSGEELGWGINVSSNVILGPATLKLQAVYGAGIENYMNDAGDDIGPEVTNNPGRPLDGEALPVLGLVGFVDMTWNELFTSTAGWSYVHIDNSDGQAATAFHSGQYALANLLFHPTEKLMMGGEFQYGRRANNGPFEVNDFKIQLSVKYSFSLTVGGK